MSVYAGLSLRQVYERRCLHYGLSVNGAVADALPDTPDKFSSLAKIDLSSNFVGRKGFLALLEVVRCAERLEYINAKGQQLDQEAVDALCAVLRKHPTVHIVNLSDNPLTIMGGTSLLQLAKDNPNIDTVLLDNTLIKGTMLEAIAGTVERNKQNKRLAAKARAGPHGSPQGLAVLSGSGTNGGHFALASASASANGEGCSEEPACAPCRHGRRPSAAKLRAVLASIPATAHPTLFDENPVPPVQAWLQSVGCQFFDPQFIADDATAGMRQSGWGPAGMEEECTTPVQRAATLRYGISSWRRVSELFPEATLLPRLPAGRALPQSSAGTGGASAGPSTAAETSSADAHVLLPTCLPKGFAWIFACADAAVDRAMDPTGEATLRWLFVGPEPAPFAADSCPGSGDGVGAIGAVGEGLYAVRLFVDGAWRYVLIDDFLPVDRLGELLFTHPAVSKAADGREQVAFWPCLLEKALAKVYGGYERLDAQTNFGVSNVAVPAEFTPPPCARTLADLTGGVGLVRRLSPAVGAANASAEEVANWDTLVELLSPEARRAAPMNGATRAMAISKCAAHVQEPGGLPGFDTRFSGIALNSTPYELLEVRQLHGVRLVRLRSHYAGVEWKGLWCEESSAWQQHPEVARAIRGDVRRAPVAAAAAATGSSVRVGVSKSGAAEVAQPPSVRTDQHPFWMSYLDFLVYFAEVHLCRIFSSHEAYPSDVDEGGAHVSDTEPVWRERLLRSEWRADAPAGRLGTSLNWHRNPHIRLQMYARGVVFLNVCSRDSRFSSPAGAPMAVAGPASDAGNGSPSSPSSPSSTSGSSSRIAVHLLQAARYPIRAEEAVPGEYADRSPEAPLRSTLLCGTRYAHTDSLTVECVLEACEEAMPYWIVPSRDVDGKGDDGHREYDDLTGDDMTIPMRDQPFYVRVFSTAPFQLSLETLEDHWCERTVDAEVPASGDLLMGEGNPQVALVLGGVPLPGGSLAPVGMAGGLGDAGQHRSGTLLGSVLVRAAVVSADAGGQGSLALFMTEAEMNAAGQLARLMGCVEREDLIAQSPHVRADAVYLERAQAVASGDAYNLLCCVQPPGRRVSVRFTMWSTLPLRHVALLPPWQHRELTVTWPAQSGSGAFYEASGHPQVEVYPVAANDRLVVRMQMLPEDAGSDAQDPTIMVTVVANHNRCGEGLLGRIPSDRILARSEYVRKECVQCEVEVGEQGMDSVLVIPCLQPAGSHGSCVITVACESGQFNLRQVGA